MRLCARVCVRLVCLPGNEDTASTPRGFTKSLLWAANPGQNDPLQMLATDWYNQPHSLLS